MQRNASFSPIQTTHFTLLGGLDLPGILLPQILLLLLLLLPQFVQNSGFVLHRRHGSVSASLFPVTGRWCLAPLLLPFVVVAIVVVVGVVLVAAGSRHTTTERVMVTVVPGHRQVGERIPAG